MLHLNCSINIHHIYGTVHCSINALIMFHESCFFFLQTQPPPLIETLYSLLLHILPRLATLPPTCYWQKNKETKNKQTKKKTLSPCQSYVTCFTFLNPHIPCLPQPACNPVAPDTPNPHPPNLPLFHLRTVPVAPVTSTPTYSLQLASFPPTYSPCCPCYSYTYIVLLLCFFCTHIQALLSMLLLRPHTPSLLLHFHPHVSLASSPTHMHPSL